MALKKLLTIPGTDYRSVISGIPGLRYGRRMQENLYDKKMHPYLEELWVHPLRDINAIYNPGNVSLSVLRSMRSKLQRSSVGFDAVQEKLTGDEALGVLMDFLRSLPAPLMADNSVARKRQRMSQLSQSTSNLVNIQPETLAWMDPADLLMLKYIVAFTRVAASDSKTNELKEESVEMWTEFFFPVIFGDPSMMKPDDASFLTEALTSIIYDPQLLDSWIEKKDIFYPKKKSPALGISQKPAVSLENVPFLQEHGILIQGGTVVNDDRMFEADVFIKDGKIQNVGHGIGPSVQCLVINAKNKYVIPGGIDPHTHFQFPFMNMVTIDDFYQGTLAALAGGTTTIIDFAVGKRGESLIDVYNRWRQWADPKVCCDYGLHVAVTGWNDRVGEEMEYLVKNHGVNSFKMFMAYKESLMVEDNDLCEIFRKCRELGSIAMVHAENGNVIAMNQRSLLSAGVTGPEGHEQSRNEDVEAEAVHRAVLIAKEVNCPLYVVHVMSKTAGEEVSKGRQKAVVFGETLAAALGTDGTNYYNKCWTHAACHIVSPPLRPDPTTPSALMDQLAKNDLQLVGSDNCTFTTSQRMIGKDDFTKIPNGVNGVEDRMSVVWHKGVNTGKIDPRRFVAITSSNAAKIFNLYPKKGYIGAGSDADVVIWDPDMEHTISSKTHHQAVDFNIFEGMKCLGTPVYVICNGKLVINAGVVNVAKGSGRFLTMNPCGGFVYDKVYELEKTRTFKKVDRQL